MSSEGVTPMFTYESGVVAAVVIGALRMTYGLIRASTPLAKNLRKIGYYYDWTITDFYGYPASVAGIISRLIWTFVISPLFSWVGVSISLFFAFVSWARAEPIPPSVQELRYKMSFRELEVGQLRQLFIESARAGGTPEGLIQEEIERIFGESA